MILYYINAELSKTYDSPCDDIAVLGKTGVPPFRKAMCIENPAALTCGCFKHIVIL